MLLIEEMARARTYEREREIAAGIRRRALLGRRPRRAWLGFGGRVVAPTSRAGEAAS